MSFEDIDPDVWRGRDDCTPARGENSRTAKLTRPDVIDIKRRYRAGGISIAALGREYGVATTTVSKIVRGLKWGHVKVPDDPGDVA